MPRSRQPRCIRHSPPATYFKPRGIPMLRLLESVLKVEELEAIRLADVEGLSASEACEVMGISRHTFGRILKNARNIVAVALVHGHALRIEGGCYFLDHARTAHLERDGDAIPSHQPSFTGGDS